MKFPLYSYLPSAALCKYLHDFGLSLTNFRMSTVGLFHSTSSGNISNPSMLMFKCNLCSRNNYKVSVWVQTDVICGCKKDFLTDSLSYKLGGWSLKDIGISRTESVCCRLYQAALLDLIILESDPSC